MIVINAKKNTIIILTLFAACLMLGYFYSLLFNTIEKKAMPTTTQYVDAPRFPVRDYFEENRLERDKLRSRQIELLRETVNNPNTAADTRKDAQKQLLDIANKMELEHQIESVLMANGLNDAVVFMRNEQVTVIIKSNSVAQDITDKVKAIVSQLADVSNEDIIVLAKN